ncbi:MAG: biotin--[acetyl-CoA-carboxylase] ligase [Microbacteriaceae bacterium]
MELPRTAAIASHLDILSVSASTNDELVAAAAGLPDLAVVVTDNQTNGRGRLGRQWIAPARAAVAVSVLVRPRLPAGEPLALDDYGWLPLISGLAMTRAVASLVPDGNARVGLKWPNDVQIDGLKVCGILAELLPTADGVVIGAGLNLAMTREQLPVETATSLALSGVSMIGDELTDAAVSRYLAELSALVREFLLSGAADSGIHAALRATCTTIGSHVRVQIPGSDDILGRATGIDDSGRLVVHRTADGHTLSVAAGDVTHVRYE